MTVRAWLRPPQRVLLLLVGVTLLLGVTLGWLSWQLLAQDRQLESQQLRGQLEEAADRVAAALRLRLEALADSMARHAPAADNDAVLVRFTRDSVHFLSGGPLPYQPVPAAFVTASATFARAESLEFRVRDLSRAAAMLRNQTQTAAPATRAGALLRLGRVLRKAGRPDSALAVYRLLERESLVTLEGLPAELVAREARVTVLEATGRTAAIEAEALYADLLEGRYRVAAGSFAFYSERLASRVPAGQRAVRDSAAAPRLALAAALDGLWAAWSGLDDPVVFHGQRNIWIGQRPVFALWRGSGREAVVLAGGPAFLRRLATRSVAGLLERYGADIGLADLDGRPLLPAEMPDRPQALRIGAETGLPWTLRLYAADISAARRQLASRRRLVLFGLATALLIVIIGLYAVTRAVHHEIAVARLQSDFVSAVSHEFRTPLTTLRQLTELLAGGRVTSEERRTRYYETLLRESERLHKLVEGLLDFGRMEAGALEFRPRPLDAGTLVSDVVREFQAEVADRGYRVACRTDNGDCPVQADPEALSRAVWNLLDNAVKYSPDERAVAVSVGRLDDHVIIRVEDRGIGISADEQQRIFEKFVRGAGSETRAVKGTGIGLAMVRHIVTAHGGDIRVESRPGDGSTFTIRLPAAETP